MAWYDDLGLSELFGVGSGDPNNPYRQALNSNAQAEGGFANYGAGQYQSNQNGIDQTEAGLASIANGNNSVSMEQARQNLAQGQQQQMSEAAAAAPQNQAMAARTAMINTGGLAGTIAGQQATEGLQERQNAYQMLGNMQTTQAGQNLQAATQGYAGANNAYGTIMQNPQQTWGNVLLKGLGGAAAIIPKFGGGGGGGGTSGGTNQGTSGGTGAYGY